MTLKQIYKKQHGEEGWKTLSPLLSPRTRG